MSKKRLLTVAYWLFASIMISCVFMGVGYSVSESLFTSVLFLPGAVAIKLLLPKTNEKDKSSSIRNAIAILLAVFIFEILLLVLAAIMIQSHLSGNIYDIDIPGLAVNPALILIILFALLAGNMFVESLLNRLFPSLKEPVTFVSDRKKTTLLPEEILYLESNDTEVWVYASDGRRFRNKTPISQWERLLGNDFLRIHRSYLVNKSMIMGNDGDKVKVGSVILPVSKKYRSQLPIS